VRDSRAVPTNLEQKAAPTEPRRVAIAAASTSPSASRTGSPTGSPESALVGALLSSTPSEAQMVSLCGGPLSQGDPGEELEGLSRANPRPES